MRTKQNIQTHWYTRLISVRTNQHRDAFVFHPVFTAEVVAISEQFLFDTLLSLLELNYFSHDTVRDHQAFNLEIVKHVVEQRLADFEDFCKRVGSLAQTVNFSFCL